MTMDDYGDDYMDGSGCFWVTMDDWMNLVTVFVGSVPFILVCFFVELAGLRTSHAHRHRPFDSPVTKLLLVHVSTVVGNEHIPGLLTCL